jgi:hypothetical protein
VVGWVITRVELITIDEITMLKVHR